MINGLYVLVVVATIFAALHFIPKAMRADAADRAAEYHLMHGPRSGCPECVGK